MPLGSYATTNPWGLFDVAGATAEWTEGFFQIPDEPIPRARYLDGSSWASLSPLLTDEIQYRGGGYGPFVQFSDLGLRIASIPGPSWLTLMSLTTAYSLVRRRRSLLANS